MVAARFLDTRNDVLEARQNPEVIISGPLDLACRDTRGECPANRTQLFLRRWDPALFNPRLLVTARALNFFGQELRTARPSFLLLLLPRRAADVLVSSAHGYKSERKKAGRKFISKPRT